MLLVQFYKAHIRISFGILVFFFQRISHVSTDQNQVLSCGPNLIQWDPDINNILVEQLAA